MSRVPQRVLRAVRLLPQAVKIGIPDEPEAPAEEPEIRPRPADAAPRPARQGVRRQERPARPVARPEPKKPEPNKELLEKISALEEQLRGAEARNAEIAAARDKLASEIDGVKADYEGRKRELEAEAASNAKKAADEARAKAKDEGWQSGHSEGLSAARAEVQKEYRDKFSALVAALEGFSQRLEGNFSELVALNQPRMIRLWSEMLRRMVQRQVELHPDTLNSVLSELLSRLSDKNQVVIYVAPEDIDALRSDMDTEFQEELRGVRHLELKPDPNVDRGSCIVETGLGVYDARWRTQMGQVESVIDAIFQQVGKENRDAQDGEGTA